MVVGPGVHTGMAINIDNPREVGADRVVNSVAAKHRYGVPVVSVDFGTSTNIDVVDASGAYIGGAIAPGLEVSETALIAATAALRRVERTSPRAAIGRNTVEAMQSGLVFGHAGLVDGLVERLVAEVGGNPTVVATGGLASTIVPHCRTVSIVDANDPRRPAADLRDEPGVTWRKGTRTSRRWSGSPPPASPRWRRCGPPATSPIPTGSSGPPSPPTSTSGSPTSHPAPTPARRSPSPGV